MKKIKTVVMLMILSSILTTFSCTKEKDTPQPTPTPAPPTSTCPTGYTGTNCVTQITPSKIRINKITVTRHPALDGGNTWDLTSNADIYVTLTVSGAPSPFFTSGVYQDANSTLDYDFTNGLPIDLIGPTLTYEIRLFDEDGTSVDDYMGGISFIPYSSTAGFPSIITIDGGGSVAFQLHVTYIF